MWPLSWAQPQTVPSERQLPLSRWQHSYIGASLARLDVQDWIGLRKLFESHTKMTIECMPGDEKSCAKITAPIKGEPRQYNVLLGSWIISTSRPRPLSFISFVFFSRALILVIHVEIS